MIKTKKDLRRILDLEKKNYFENNFKYVSRLFINTENAIIWKFQKRLRFTEYYLNTNRKIHYLISLIKLNKLRNKYCLHIALNVFDEGLLIRHIGPILVNGRCNVGKNCTLHINTALVARGNDDSVPVIGNNVVIGVGVTIVGGIHIANGIAIGANALVNKSFEEENIAIAGVPAKKISDNGKNTWGRKE